MTDLKSLAIANDAADAACDHLRAAGVDLQALGGPALFDQLSAVIVAALTSAQPDVRRLGFVIGNESEHRRLLIGDFDLADIRAKAAAAKAAGITEITLPLPKGWSARVIGFYIDEDGDPKAPEGVFLGAGDREDVFTPDGVRWETLPPQAQEVADQGGEAALDAFLASRDGKLHGEGDLDDAEVAGACLFVNPETLGVSVEVTTWADSDNVLTSQGFHLSELDAPAT